MNPSLYLSASFPVFLPLSSVEQPLFALHELPNVEEFFLDLLHDLAEQKEVTAAMIKEKLLISADKVTVTGMSSGWETKAFSPSAFMNFS